MDQRERIPHNLDMQLLMALNGFQNELWTAMPGTIDTFDAATCTAQVKIPIQILFKIGNNDPTPMSIPVLPDVPVYFPNGGGYTMTFPVAPGDECLVVFSSRCIDGWYSQGGTPTPVPSARMHNLSDGFALIGVRSLKRQLANVSTDSVQIRNDQKDTLLEIKNGGIININSTASVNVNTVVATVNASSSATIVSPSIILKNAGSALKKLVNETFLTLFDAHVHTSAVAGNPTTPPTVPSTPTNKTTVVQAE